MPPEQEPEPVYDEPEFDAPVAGGGQEEYIEVELFNVGERVSAQWTDLAFYPAEIRDVMEHQGQCVARLFLSNC